MYTPRAVKALDLTQGKPPLSPQDHYMIFIDTTHCRVALDKDTDTDVIVVAAVACTMVALIAFRIGKCYQLRHQRQGYGQVSSIERTSLCSVTKVSSRKKFCTIRAEDDNDAKA